MGGPRRPPLPPPLWQGQTQRGNIDLNNRPQVQNPDGGTSTVFSMSFGTDDGEIVVPRVSDDGRILSEQEAIEQYRRTGRHLGMFKPNHWRDAEAFAQNLHNGQAIQYGLEPRPQGNALKPWRK
jgi:hypothetical protein